MSNCGFVWLALAAVAAPSQAAQAPHETPAKFQEYSPVVTRLVGEMIASSPQSWDHGVLTIHSDGVRLTYQLKNESSEERASLSPGLIESIDELYVRMRSNGESWTDARFEFTTIKGQTKFTSSFVYAVKP